MGDRNTEIWSTRLQREILALESSDDESKKIELLPPFIKTIGHTLNIEGGIAKIEFRIDVEVPEKSPENAVEAKSEEEAVEKEGGEDDNEIATKDENEGKESAAKEESTGDEKGDNDAAAGEGADTDAQEPKDTETSESKDETKTKEVGETQPEAETDPHVILVLDASLYWRPDSSTSQSTSPQCYPFQKPLAIVKSGSNLFSGGSTIGNGDEVDIDLDWTPSIHLSDAVTNVALKIRECVKRGEPLHPARRDDYDDIDGLSGSILREAREAKESLLETKKAMGAMFSSGLSSLSAKGSSFAAKGQTASKSMSKGFMSLGESLSSMATEAGAGAKKGEAGTEGGGAGEEGTSNEEARKEIKEIPDIGDEIDLSDEPWNQCIGMYSCKAIKRPAFVEAAVANAAKNQKKEKEVRNE